MVLRMKNFNILGRAWTVCHFKGGGGGLCKKEAGSVFKGARVDTPMHTMKLIRNTLPDKSGNPEASKNNRGSSKAFQIMCS